MIVFANGAFSADDVDFIECTKDDNKDKPFLLSVYLKSGKRFGLRYPSERSRDNAFHIVTEKVGHNKRQDEAVLLQRIQTLQEEVCNARNDIMNTLRYIRDRFQITDQENIPKGISDASNISKLDLSVRSTNCLRRAGVNTIGDIRQLGQDGLKRVRNLGKKSYEEVNELVLQKTGQPII